MLTDDEIGKAVTALPAPPTTGAELNDWVYTLSRAIIAAYQAKLLEGVEMPESNGYRIGTDGECEGVFTSKERQAYAAAVAAQARSKALEEAAAEFEGLYSLGGDDIAKCLRQMKGKV